MHRGHIKLWRCLQDNFLWKERRQFSKAEAWIDILWEVRHSKKPQEMLIKGKLLVCNRGESLYSIQTWANRWHWTRNKTWRFLQLLQKCNMIVLKSETVTERLSVCGYDIYNELQNYNRTQIERTQNADRTQIDTNKNDKNGKNDKNDITAGACAPTCEAQNEPPQKRDFTKEAGAVLDYLNSIYKTSYRKKDNITARLREGYTVEDCIKVIDNKRKDPYFRANPKLLNPVTLFRPSHFENYLNEGTINSLFTDKYNDDGTLKVVL